MKIWRPVRNAFTFIVEWLFKVSVFSTNIDWCTRATVKENLKPERRSVFRTKTLLANAIYLADNEELDHLEILRILTPIDHLEGAAPILIEWKLNNSIRISGGYYNTGLKAPFQKHHY